MGIFPVIFGTLGILFLFNASNANTFYLFPVLLGAGCQEGQFFEKLDWVCKKSRYGKPVKCLVEAGIFLIGISLRTNYNYFGIVDGILALSLAALTGDLLIRIPVVSGILRFLGKHSGNMFLIHNQIYSYYFVGLIYGCGHWLLVFGMLVAVSLGCSVAMEAIKDLIHYRTWMEKVGNNFCNKQKLWYNNYEREMKEL